VRPPSSAALRVQGETAVRAAPAATRAAEGRPAPRPRSASTSSGEEIIDVPAEEMDLAALAELAKNAAERKT
jgi:hypothetical protein